MSAIVQLFSNPDSGSFAPQWLSELRRAFEAAGAQVIDSESSPRHPPQIDARASHVCVAGGDGTLRHVAAALAGQGRALPLAHYPLGTINLVAREAGFSLDPRQLADRLLGDRARRRHFVGELNQETFLCCISIGPDSVAIGRHSPALKARFGRLAYGAALLGLLVRWQRPKLSVIVDGKTIACEAIYIAKGRYFAGPFSFAPAARLTEDRFHVVTLGRARRRDYLLFLFDLASGRDPAQRTGNRAFACRELAVEGPAQALVQADGDIAATLPITVRVNPTPLVFA